MEAGFKTTEECVLAFDKLKMHKHARFLTFKVEGSNIVLENTGERTENWESFVKTLPKEQSRYIVYDFTYTTKDQPPREVEKLIFIYWSPDEAPAKDKMLSATARGAFRKNLMGVARDIQAKDFSDLEFDEVRDKL